jgi:trimeric autotransporter adhesin
MRKIYLLLISTIILSGSLFSQNVNVNPGAGSYPTLKAAFDAINLGTHTGVITVDIVGNTTETASAVLNASGVGGASYTSIVISPSGGASRTISGAIAGHMIDLNGANNVTIDGLNSGGNTLFIDNSDAGTGTSTIRFTNDASNNTIRKTNLLGSSGASGSTGFGVVYFGTGTITGNDNNIISTCNISSSVGGNPINAIYSLGTSTAIDNSGNTVTICNVADYYNTNSASSGLNINSGNSGWSITNNTFYQTATRTYLTGSTHNGIFISSGSAYTINNNVIGYSAPNATGTTNMIGLSSGSLTGTFPTAFTAGGVSNVTSFVGINCTFTAAGTVSNIQNNTIGVLPYKGETLILVQLQVIQ